MESLPQLEPTRQLNVDRAYVLLWSHSPDGNRSAFQRVQLRRLGIPTRLVVGCDQEDLTPAQRACMFGSKLYGMPKLPKDERKYASQLVKLWAALLDFARSGLAWSLFVEDDVVVQFPRLPSVNFVLANVRPLGILYVSSYSPIGFDMVSCGVHPRLSWVLGGGRPTALMAGVANIIPRASARQMLTSVPIEASGTDEAFTSLGRNSTPIDGYIVKPYPFTAGAYGGELFSCGFDLACERGFYRSFRAGGRGNYSTWISLQLARESLPASRRNEIPSWRALTSGCDEMDVRHLSIRSYDARKKSMAGAFSAPHNLTIINAVKISPMPDSQQP